MAIAFDAFSAGSNSSSTTLTVSHTCSGSGRLLVVGIRDPDTGDRVSGVTYNGVAMTRILHEVNATAGHSLFLYYLLNPATGANNIVVTFTGSVSATTKSASYTGVAQTTPNTSNGFNGTAGAATTVSVTSTVPLVWLMGFYVNTGGDATSVDDSGAIRNTSASSEVFVDSNGTRAAGAQSLTVNHPSGLRTAIAVAFQQAQTISQLDTFVISENSLGYTAKPLILNNVTMTEDVDTEALGTLWRNQDKNDSTWTNQDKN